MITTVILQNIVVVKRQLHTARMTPSEKQLSRHSPVGGAVAVAAQGLKLNPVRMLPLYVCLSGFDWAHNRDWSRDIVVPLFSLLMT